MKIIIDGIEKLSEAFDVIVKGADGIALTIEGDKALNLEKAKDLVFYLPPISASVLTSKSVTPIRLVNYAKEIGVNTLMLEGNIFTNDIAIIRDKLPYMKIIKLLKVIDKNSLKEAEEYKKFVDALLIEVDIMNNDKLLLCKKIIDNCDYVLIKAKVTKDYLAVLKELDPYGIVIDYDENDKLKSFIKAIKF